MSSVKTVETKKSQKSAPAQTASQAKHAQTFLSDVKAEFKKITWTNKEELKVYTKIVVSATFLCGMGVYFVDILIRAALSTLEQISRLFF